MTLSHWQRQELGPDIHCDVAVIGGGIVGVSTAYWLKKLAPRSRVVLVESSSLGYGASGRNAGFLLQGAAVDYVTDVNRYGEENARRLWRFTLENRRLIETELTPSRIALQSGGSLILAGEKGEAERLEESARLLNAMEEPVDYWPAGKVENEIKGKGFCGGLKVVTGAKLDSLKLVREIAGCSGAIILEGHPVYHAERTPEGLIIRTRKRDIYAEKAVFCMNAYLPNLFPETKQYIQPVRAQMLATKPVASWLTYPIYSHEGYYYVRQLASGALLVGGARNLFVEEEAGYEDTTTPHLQQALIGYLNQYFPHLKDLTPEYNWSGTMAFTPDGLPIFSPVSSMPGSFWAAGFNGHGMGYGFRFGKMMANVLEGNQDITFAPMFDVKRFEAGNLNT